MPPGSAPADPGRDENLPGTPSGPGQDPPPGDPGPAEWEPVITRPDPMTEEEREAWLDALAGEAEALDPEEYPDPEGPPPPGEDELTAEEIAGIRDLTEAEARAAGDAARSGTTGALAAIAMYGSRRAGQPGSARVFPGESSSRAAAFGSGLALDVTPGCPDLAMLADAAAGPDDTFDGVSDDELIGVLSAWDRLEAHMAARKLAAAAELIASSSASWHRCSRVRVSSASAGADSASSTACTAPAHSGVRSPCSTPAPPSVVTSRSARSSNEGSWSWSGSSARYRW